jgi:DNA mismatch repair protein MutS2
MTNEHGYALLEFARIREDVAGYCVSEEGRLALLDGLPFDAEEPVRALKASVSALVALFREGIEAPGFAFPPIAEAARRASKAGSALEIEELYALGLWAESFAAFSAFVSKARDGGVDAALAGTPELSGVPRVVFRILNRDGSLRDLPELRGARERIAKAHRDIAAMTDSFYRDPEVRAMLQSDEPTQRDGRTVLALRANFKGRVRRSCRGTTSSSRRRRATAWSWPGSSARLPSASSPRPGR